jgi:HPt (histidine-containing phosphotransfer) domain-containing protein
MFLAHGFQAFLSKPIDIMAMDVVIRRWVRNRELEKEHKESSAKEIPLYSADHPTEWTILDAATPAATQGTMVQGTLIPGIDAEKGAAHFGGDLSIYGDVVKSYAQNTPPLLDKIRTLAAEPSAEDINDYAIIVHGIKSSSRSIGAEVLGDQAEELEYAAKAGNAAFIREHHGVFIQAADQLLAGITGEISRTAMGNPKPRKTEPAGETLEDLKEACRTFDIDGVDKAMAELESCEYETGAELIAWLREKADGMGFKEIAGRLA